MLPSDRVRRSPGTRSSSLILQAAHDASAGARRCLGASHVGEPCEQQYLELLAEVLARGARKADRNGTLSVFGWQMRFDPAAGYPLLPTKQLHLKSIV